MGDLLQAAADRIDAIAGSRHESLELGRAATVEGELGYFVRNVARMQYGTPTNWVRDEFQEDHAARPFLWRNV